MRTTAVLAMAALLWGCGGDPSGPSQDLAGTYALTQLRFDPQGVLPEVDLLERLDVTDIQLVLAPDGQAQLRYVNPTTGLVTTVDGTYSTPTDAARVHLDAGAALRVILLPARLTYAYSATAATMRFEDVAPDGIDRQRLLELVPEWGDEQLLSPVPGELTVEFTGVPPSLQSS